MYIQWERIWRWRGTWSSAATRGSSPDSPAVPRTPAGRDTNTHWHVSCSHGVSWIPDFRLFCGWKLWIMIYLQIFLFFQWAQASSHLFGSEFEGAFVYVIVCIWLVHIITLMRQSHAQKSLWYLKICGQTEEVKGKIWKKYCLSGLF